MTTSHIENQSQSLLLEKILEKAKDQFFQKGIRNVTMEDLARELGISKKTIYQFIENKADLVNKSLVREIQISEKSIKKLLKKADNAIEEMLLIRGFVMETLERFKMPVLQDLEKFYPESWKLIEKHRQEFIAKTILDNIKKGIQEGLYRKDLCPDLTAGFYLSTTSQIVDNRLLMTGNKKHSELYREYLQYHIYAICTESGLNKFKEHQEKDEII